MKKFLVICDSLRPVVRFPPQVNKHYREEALVGQVF